MTITFDLINNHITEKQFKKAVEHICIYFDEIDIDFIGALVVLDIITKVIKEEMNIVSFGLMNDKQ